MHMKLTYIRWNEWINVRDDNLLLTKTNGKNRTNRLLSNMFEFVISSIVQYGICICAIYVHGCLLNVMYCYRQRCVMSLSNWQLVFFAIVRVPNIIQYMKIYTVYVCVRICVCAISTSQMLYPNLLLYRPNKILRFIESNQFYGVPVVTGSYRFSTLYPMRGCSILLYTSTGTGNEQWDIDR